MRSSFLEGSRSLKRPFFQNSKTCKKNRNYFDFTLRATLACKKRVMFTLFARRQKSKIRLFCTAWGLGTQNLHGLGPRHAESRAKSLQEDEEYRDLGMKCMKEARFARLTHMGWRRFAPPPHVCDSFHTSYANLCVPRLQAVQILRA